jgi:hypothetical protein
MKKLYLRVRLEIAKQRFIGWAFNKVMGWIYTLLRGKQ